MSNCKHCGILERYHSATGPCDYYEAEITAEDTKQRRERIATAAMQGLLSNPGIIGSFGTCNLIAKEAIEQADALIKALDEVKK